MGSPPAAIITTRTKPYENSTEFARLYYFFDKLTQPRSRGRTQDQESMSLETATDGPVPEDIAPLLKNLSAILTKDEPVDGYVSGASEAQVSIPETPTTALASTFDIPAPHPATDHASTRPRRNTVAVSAPQSQPSTRAAAVAIADREGPPGQTRFPLRERRYPFTFKLLLHKLYDLEDWAAKVQEVLAASQEQFRSLGSTPASGGGGGGGGNNNNNSPGGPRSPGSPGTATFSGSLFGTAPLPVESPPTRRRRAQSTKATDAATARPGPASPRPPQTSRAVKKRIVNRRRSTSGLGEVGKMGEWTYDAAVSSVDAENADAKGHDSLRRRKRVLSSVGFGEGRRFVGHDVTNTNIGRYEDMWVMKSQHKVTGHGGP
ncbi:hypothetical protein BC826DRAFT_973033 [Russula brevipes]|nr:hypothetical protein BC826DRAFT_973033 [Russula brevipes]